MHPVTKFLLTITAFFGSIVLYTAVHIPGVTPMLCPWCLGFQRLEPGLYIEGVASQADRQQTEARLRKSKLAVGRYFGPLQSDPTIFICITDGCYDQSERRGGRTVGISFLDWVIVLSPRAAKTDVAMTHELSHTELHTRLGPQMFKVPRWFDEGLAVYVSNDSRYLAPPGSGTRCIVETPKRLPLNGATWTSATEDTDTPYAESACLVSIWLEHRDGEGTVLRFVSDIKAGIPFARAYAARPNV